VSSRVMANFERRLVIQLTKTGLEGYQRLSLAVAVKESTIACSYTKDSEKGLEPALETHCNG
jgi:hypothetical protein